MNDMSKAIIPKSDQLNADDLLTGPITIKVTGVTVRGGQEQPVSISYEGDNGKPYKACKSMCRVLVSAWGADSSKYVGRSMTLFCDPKVKWGGMEVGGIRISHMSHISDDMTMALTVTRANKRPFTVRPIVAAGTTTAPPRADSGAASSPHPAEPPVSGTTISDADLQSLLLAVEQKGIKQRFSAKLAASGIKSPDEIPAGKAKAIRDWVNEVRAAG